MVQHCFVALFWAYRGMAGEFVNTKIPSLRTYPTYSQTLEEDVEFPPNLYLIWTSNISVIGLLLQSQPVIISRGECVGVITTVI